MILTDLDDSPLFKDPLGYISDLKITVCEKIPILETIQSRASVKT